MRNDAIYTPMTRREALRRAVLFSTGVLATGKLGCATAGPPATTRFSGKGIDLLALGDFGTSGNRRQKSVADGMAEFAKALDQPLSAVLALGDNFYGKMSVERFDKHFDQIYSAKQMDCPFYALLGNHDYGTAVHEMQPGRAQMQLEYAANNPRSRWKMPAKWYAIELPDAENPLVKIVMLDGCFFPGALTPQEKIDQRRWLAAELAKETQAPWIWMASHYPMFSQCTKRGRGDNMRLIDEWGPHLKEYDVALYLAGHDHDMQHLRIEGYPTSFVVNGAGGAGNYDCDPSSRGFTDDEELGFNHFHVTADRIDVQFITAEGRCLHAFSQDRAGKVEIKAA
jgi:hypothetical protein